MAQGDSRRRCVACCCALISFLILVPVVVMLVEAYAVVRPVLFFIDVTLARMSPANATELDYDVYLSVAVMNPNWAMRAEHTAPLDAELFVGGETFARDRLEGAGHTLKAEETDSYQMVKFVTPKFVSDRASIEPLFQLVLRLAGEVRYLPPDRRNRRLEARCALTLPRSTLLAAQTYTQRLRCV